MAAPQVTIVLATCGNSEYLPAALASVSLQTYASWELIVVDDGGPDPAAIEELAGANERTRVIRQAHGGLSVARNTGCLAASGRYLTFLDNDDYWPRERLELQVAALESRPECVGCYGKLVYIDAAGATIGAGPDPSSRAAALAAGFHIGTLMLRRAAVSRAGLFDPMLSPAEDLDFSMRLAYAGQLAYIPHVLLLYRRHAASMMAQAPAPRGIGRAVYDYRLRLAELHGDRPAVAAIAQVRRDGERYFRLEALRLAQHALLRGHARRAVQELRDAVASSVVIARMRRRRPSHVPEDPAP